jgi:DNA-binding CsgD family transcriptional regulator
LIAHVVPIVGEAQDVFALARAVLIVTDPDDVRRDPTALLVPTFGLTGAEARLASLVGKGMRLTDIAELQGITIETARSRLKAVFAKTGTHRQSELAATIASLTR